MNLESENPTFHIAINKSRLKQYEKKSETPLYYVDDTTSFQIELYNPLNEKILCDLSFNDSVIIDRYVILDVGERLFLDIVKTTDLNTIKCEFYRPYYDFYNYGSFDVKYESSTNNPLLGNNSVYYKNLDPKLEVGGISWWEYPINIVSYRIKSSDNKIDNNSYCNYCDFLVKKSFKYCPMCGTKLGL